MLTSAQTFSRISSLVSFLHQRNGKSLKKREREREREREGNIIWVSIRSVIRWSVDAVIRRSNGADRKKILKDSSAEKKCLLFRNFLTRQKKKLLYFKTKKNFLLENLKQVFDFKEARKKISVLSGWFKRRRRRQLTGLKNMNYGETGKAMASWIYQFCQVWMPPKIEIPSHLAS